MSFKKFSTSLKTLNGNSAKPDDELGDAPLADKPAIPSKDTSEPAHPLSRP